MVEAFSREDSFPDAIENDTIPAVDVLQGNSAEHYRRVLTEGIDRIATTVAALNGPCTGATPDQLQALLDEVDLNCPLPDAASALDELTDVYLQDAIYTMHPRYLAHLSCPVAIPALLGEAVLSAVNTSMDTWDQSTGATLIELRLIAWAAGLLGFGPAADGVFTSGGTQSNLQALLLAREEALARAGGEAVRHEVQPAMRILMSEVAHFSVHKAARVLGLGRDALIPVGVDEQWQLRPDLLARQLSRCQARGEPVVAVVATAGTTDFGSIDPLPQIAELCEQLGVWLHVDAAYGCGLLVSPTRRHLLAGVERADSVTLDFHKAFSQPISSSALMVRDGSAMRHATDRADYLNPAWMAESGLPNLVDKSLQTTRRFDALKLWLTLRMTGAPRLGRSFDTLIEQATEVRRVLAADPRWEIVSTSPLSTIVFRYRPVADVKITDDTSAHGAVGAAEVPDAVVDAANLHARETIANLGVAMVAATIVRGRHHLKLTLLNPNTQVADVVAVTTLIAEHAEAYLRHSHDVGANGVGDNIVAVGIGLANRSAHGPDGQAAVG